MQTEAEITIYVHKLRDHEDHGHYYSLAGYQMKGAPQNIWLDDYST